MRALIIIGNWKMNKTVADGVSLANVLREKLHSNRAITKLEVIIAPPYTALSKIADILRDSSLKISAQDMFWEDFGAFTGQISASMIKDAGATHVIIGHSERRQFFHETDTEVNKKIVAALKHDLIPIFCIGETLIDREERRVKETITAQITNGLSNIVRDDITKIVIAYEPVWAIGTGITATPEQAEEVHTIIRELLTKKIGESYANVIRIIYGGSVKPSNAMELLSKPNIDGVLVGGASLKAEDFIGIIKNIAV
ncbi:MAG: triose-phosphate isomerase [Coxiellaceae bacterium]|jgi:triosephosphate isomerase|nr:triose-phosphate isomerase [Coxiellaceae bacterium]